MRTIPWIEADPAAALEQALTVKRLTLERLREHVTACLASVDCSSPEQVATLWVVCEQALGAAEQYRQGVEMVGRPPSTE